MSRLRTFHFGEVPAQQPDPATMICGKPWVITPVRDLVPEGPQYAFTSPENIDAAARAPRMRTAFGDFFVSAFEAHAVDPRDTSFTRRVICVVAIGRIVGRADQIQEFMAACNNSLLRPIEFSVVINEQTFNCRQATCTSVGQQVEAGGIMIVESLQFTLQENVLAAT
jgi:hypothetical protein